MSKGIAMSCGNKDIISTMKSVGFKVNHVVEPLAPSVNLRLEEIASSLDKASRDAGYALLAIQTKAVCRILHRPSATMTVSSETYGATAGTATFSTPASDLRSPVILDMPTGTGKTVTALLGSILFAIERKVDIEQAQPDVVTVVSGPTNPCELSKYPSGCYPSSPVTGKCIIFTPRHLIQHWVNQGAIAKRIVEGMTFHDGSTWSVRLVKNKFASQEQVGHNEVLVIICDSSRCGIKRLEPSVYYSSICFDEAGERGAKVNAMLQIMEPNIMYGRMLICSADFEKWATLSVKVNTVMRHVFRDWEGGYHGLGVAATCFAAAVFNERERPGAITESTHPLESAIVNTATVTYKPSLMERLVGGYGVDLGDDIGCDVFEKTYGLRVSDCLTVSDVINAITDKVDSHIISINALQGKGGMMARQLKDDGDFLQNYNGARYHEFVREVFLLERLKPKIRCLLADDCPICLEPMKDLTFLQPCLHVACKYCHEKLSGTCPMCRRDMRGAVGISMDKRPLEHVRLGGGSDRASESSHEICAAGSGSDSMDVDEKTMPPSDARIGDLFYDEMATLCGDNEPGGVVQAMYNTVVAVQNARNKSDRADQTLRTVIICPGVDMRGGDSLFEGLGCEVLHYKSSGTKHSPVTMKRMDSCMNKFTAADGKSKVLFVRDAVQWDTKDSMTGLDINGLDCVVAIGSDNFTQRVGRLCRLSRTSLPEKVKHALYVEIVPNEEIIKSPAYT